MNIFILKAHYIKKVSPDQPFGCSMGLFKNARKMVTPIRKAISSLDLSLDKHFDQIDFTPSELISLIGLIPENNSSSGNRPQSTLTPVISLTSSVRSKTLLQRLRQIGICSFYRHIIDIISDRAADVLQVYN